MKILVVSDTHRKDDNLKLVLSEECPLDMLIHLGDAEGSEHFIPDWVNPECRMEMVLGNNDFFSRLDREREIDIAGHKAFITHGHYYGVSMGPEGLVDEAKSRGCDIVMYGHTHRPFLDVIDGVTVLNPGSLSYPRQEGRRPSYMIIHVDADGKMDYQQKYL
ncbi:MAG: metallophosphoesterase [Lachnospiraceae bacterium]|nr:metallophosphoesterase [Lachnospiraceae bacterium]